jgi:hypothetical protein
MLSQVNNLLALKKELTALVGEPAANKKGKKK